jgi:hypothetical protein
MYLAIAALGVFVLAATFLVEGGGKSTATVGIVTVHDLLNSSDLYDDREVATRGTLEFEEESDTYYVREAEDRIRVAFDEDISEFIGADVRATGRLAYDDEGVYMDAHRVRPTDV